MTRESEDMFANMCHRELTAVSFSPGIWHHVVNQTIAKLVVHPETLPSVPSAECILSHLPKDRLPTVEELRAAWRACAV
jgi:hypothetical protein